MVWDGRGRKRVGKILRLVDDLAVLKLHDADGLKRLSLVGDHVFRHPEVPGANHATDVEAGRFSRMVSAQGLQVAAATDPFTRLRIFTEHVIILNVLLWFRVS